MGVYKYTAIVVATTFVAVRAQTYEGVTGFGGGPESYVRANENPLNKTSVDFAGFNFDTDAGSTDNATSGQWTWNAGLSIINVDTNETNYPISSAAQSASNVINVAYTLDFPGDQLPEQNSTDWTICSHVFSVPWTDGALRRAANDPGDCSAVLGTACWTKIRQGWSGLAGSNCPQGPAVLSISECDAATSNGWSFGSAPIMSWPSDQNNSSSPRVGLQSGQIISYQSGPRFDGASALAEYNKDASALRMSALTFFPSKAFVGNHSGTLNPGEVRLFCTVMNKQAPRPNGASYLKPSNLIGISILFWTLSFFVDLF